MTSRLPKLKTCDMETPLLVAIACTTNDDYIWAYLH